MIAAPPPPPPTPLGHTPLSLPRMHLLLLPPQLPINLDGLLPCVGIRFDEPTESTGVNSAMLHA